MNLDELTTEDVLSMITSALVGERDNEDILLQIFTQPTGKWIDLVALCNQSVELSEQIQTIDYAIEGHLIATWVDYSEFSYGPGFRAIIFLSEPSSWNSVAIYNYARLSKMNQ